jgi:SAM-dependent methyltransferase
MMQTLSETASPLPRPRGRRPTFLGISMVKNEQDIIEPFVRHNLHFLDWLIILDNNSQDDTRDIIAALAYELGRVIVADVPEAGYSQSERMTALLQAAQSAFFADYVLPLDADEFLLADDIDTFINDLAAIGSPGIGLMAWKTFVLTPEALAADPPDPPRSICNARREENPQYYKAVLRLDGGVYPDLVIEQGNHSVTDRSGRPLSRILLPAVSLAHFPVRSQQQYISKNVIGWMAYLIKNPNARTSPQGFHWRDAFELIARGEAITDERVCAASLHYASSDMAKPVETIPERPPVHYVRRYSTGHTMSSLALIARSWEQSLLPRSPLLRFDRPPVTEIAAVPRSAAPGVFDVSWHWDNLFVDVPPFRFMAGRYRPHSVLDVGCGIGAYLQLFEALGAKSVFGIDGLPASATARRPDQYAEADLNQPVRIDQLFDLVVCVELAEHLAPDAANRLVDTLAGLARTAIVFSAAQPRQPGHGHINCRPIGYWLARWRALGWTPVLADSLGMRALATLSWFRRNLVVLARPSQGTEDDAAAVLEDIARRPFAWYGQPPGVREYCLDEALPPPPAGYPPPSSRPARS